LWETPSGVDLLPMTKGLQYMPSLRDIKRRINSIRKTAQITRAMKMVSASKLRRAQERIIALRPYSRKMLEVVGSMALRASESTHPLLQKGDGDVIELVVVTADKGLCGGFNNNIIKQAIKVLAEGDKDNVNLTLVGKKGRDYFKRIKVSVRNVYVDIFSKLGYEHAVRISQEIIKTYTEEHIQKVLLIYNEFKSAISQVITMEQLLPIIPMEIKQGEVAIDFLYEPSQEEIFKELLPRHIEIQIYHALLESLAAEHAARMTAMDSASKNAAEIIDNLTLKFNKARQAAITKELLEIVGGAEALKG